MLITTPSFVRVAVVLLLGCLPFVPVHARGAGGESLSPPRITRNGDEATPLSRTAAFQPAATTTLTRSATVQTIDLLKRINTTAANYTHTAIPLQDGTVLVSGGESGLNQMASSVRYDPITQTLSGGGGAPRAFFTSTLLPDGTVLHVGGIWENDVLRDVDRYDPSTRQFVGTGILNQPRINHTATLLRNGKLLITGGFTNGSTTLRSSELYDPATGTFSLAGSLNVARSAHTATLLQDGRVLIVSGTFPRESSTNPVEVYDPATDTFTVIDNFPYLGINLKAILLNDGRVFITNGNRSAIIYNPVTRETIGTELSRDEPQSISLTLLADGKVLIMKDTDNFEPTTAEIYDPETNSSTAAGRIPDGHFRVTATRLADDTLLIGGGNRLDRARLRAENTFTATMTLPDGWLTTAKPVITLTGDTSDVPLLDASLNDGQWFAMQPGVPITTTPPAIQNGRARPIRLELRDTNLRSTAVVVGYVDIDTQPPRSIVPTLPAVSPPTFTVTWSGKDATSGIAAFDVEVRDGAAGAWMPVVTNTMALSTTFKGEPGHRYFFRIRAHDVAGNVEVWPDVPDTSTRVDSSQPTRVFVPLVRR